MLHAQVSALLAMLVAAAVQAQDPANDPPTLTIPAFCGFAHPDPGAVHRDASTRAVRECRGSLVFYVDVARPGRLTIHLTRKAAASPAIVLQVCDHPGHDVVGSGTFPAANAAAVDLGEIRAPKPGTLRFELSTADGSPLRDIRALHLGGEAAAGAHTLTVERRNAASVHLWYDVPAAHRDDIEWFACELEPKADPLWSYYMATGWHRGYFGMQVNSATERRVIFSVWDSGNEAVDRDKVAADDRVQLVKKGEGVVADGFGNEGTGGHSHLVHDWQLGDRLQFVVRAEPDGTHTTYTGWFRHTHASTGTTDDWRLVASFRAPKDGRLLHGLYSFSENFSGANGDLLRECDYGPVWLRTRGGAWLPVRSAKFTHDGHGDQHRLDRSGGVRGDRFFLRHGDFATPTMPRGTTLELPTGEAPPPPSLPE